MKDYEEKVINIMDSAKDNIRIQFDKAYKSGYEDAKSELGKNAVDLTHEESDRAYQQGLDDAWEAARKLVHPKLGGYTEKQKQRIFGEYVSSDSILQNFTASEAIANIKEYEEKQDTIQVGDEVYSEMYDLRFIVTRIYDGKYEGICTDGAAYCPLPDDVKKTGRHTEKILKVLGEFDEKD